MNETTTLSREDQEIIDELMGDGCGEFAYDSQDWLEKKLEFLRSMGQKELFKTYLRVLHSRSSVEAVERWHKYSIDEKDARIHDLSEINTELRTALNRVNVLQNVIGRFYFEITKGTRFETRLPEVPTNGGKTT